MAEIIEDTKERTRNLPINDALRRLLGRAAEAAGIELVRITSGGQPALGSGGKRVGSTRHDLGRAADLDLWIGGKPLSFTDSSAPSAIVKFVTACAQLGATGIGAGCDYMGSRSLHIGFGQKAVWGAGGHSATAPQWLRDAVTAGWANAVVPTFSTYAVAARDGLHLRAGPGIDYKILSTLDAGTPVSVTQFDGKDLEWARVSLKGDSLIDGHLHRAFLVPELSGGLSLDSHDEELETDHDHAQDTSASLRKKRAGRTKKKVTRTQKKSTIRRSASRK